MTYCITHEVEFPDMIFRASEDCVVVGCPPPELPVDWEQNLVEPSEEELVEMDMNAEVLETDLGL